MWWLDDGPLHGIQPKGDPSHPPAQDLRGHLRASLLHAEKTGSDRQARCVSAADANNEQPQASAEASELLRQLDAETACRLAAETELAETGLQHAEQLAALRLQIRILEESVETSEVTYKDLTATIAQRDAAHAEQLAEMKQKQQDREAALRESESQRAAEKQSLRSELASLQGLLDENEVARSELEAKLEQHDSAHAAELAALTQQSESLQSNLRTLEQTLAESETARDDLQAAITQRDATLAAQLVESDQARESTAVRAEELTAEIISLQEEAAALRSRLETAIKDRLAADCAMEQCRAIHAADLARLDAEIQSLQQARDAHEALRREAESAAEQREAECSLALVEAGQAQEAAQRRANELAAQLEVTDTERVTLQVNLQTEIQAHSIAATKWRELELHYVSQTESLRSKLLNLERLVQENRIAQQRTDSEVTRSKQEHAAELARLQAETQSLQQTLDKHEALRREAEAAGARRETESSLALLEAVQAREAAQQLAEQLAAQLEAMDIERAALQVNLETEIQAHLISKAQWHECEQQHVIETESLQSKLRNLEQLIREHKTARQEADLELTRSKQEHAVELAELRAARQAADRCNTEIKQQRLALQRQLELSAARADEESESRVAAETELQRLTDEFRQLSVEAEKARCDHQELQRHGVEQREALVTGCARLRQDLDDRERQLRERDELIARQATKLEHWQETEERIQFEKEQLSVQHAEQTMSLEAQVNELRSLAEEERASKMRLDHEFQQLAEKLGQLLAAECRLRLWSQSQATALRIECTRRQHELDQLQDALAAAIESQRAGQKRVEEETDRVQMLTQQLDATKSFAAEMEARKTSELSEMLTALTERAAELAASREQIKRMEQQLQEAKQCNKDERQRRQQAAALADSLTQDATLLRKRAEAFRGLAQRQAAERKKLEVAIKRYDDGVENTADLVAIRARIEVNERIRRLTTELAAMRNQELSVRQRAMREIKRAQGEVQQLKDQLARERRAA